MLAPLPPQVRLPFPAAAFVRLLPGCVWSNGSKTIAITRKTGQGFNLVELTPKPHRFVQAAGAHVPMPSWMLRPYESVGFIVSVPTTVVITTCAGAARLTVTVAPRISR